MCKRNFKRQHHICLTSKYFWIWALAFSNEFLSVFPKRNLNDCEGNSKLRMSEHNGRNFRCNSWNCDSVRDTTQPVLIPSSPSTVSFSNMCTTITNCGGSFSSGIYNSQNLQGILLRTVRNTHLHFVQLLSIFPDFRPTFQCDSNGPLTAAVLLEAIPPPFQEFLKPSSQILSYRAEPATPVTHAAISFSVFLFSQWFQVHINDDYSYGFLEKSEKG